MKQNITKEVKDYLKYGVKYDVTCYVSALSVINNHNIRNEKKQPFKFSMCCLNKGNVIYLSRNKSITCVINDETTVIYNGTVYSLSPLARMLLSLKTNPQGPACFSYNGETLDEIRKKNGF